MDVYLKASIKVFLSGEMIAIKKRPSYDFSIT